MNLYGLSTNFVNKHQLQRTSPLNRRVLVSTVLHHVQRAPFHRYRGPSILHRAFQGDSQPCRSASTVQERSCPRIPGIQDVDDTLARRLQTLLDDLAGISLCEKGNVSATTACLKSDKGTLQTSLYSPLQATCNRQPPDAHRGRFTGILNRNLRSHPQLLIRHLCTSR